MGASLGERGVSFPLDEFRGRIAALAAQGIYVGTSSWKYPGWCGQIYTPERYEYRGAFAKTRFERDCLTEYAETFRTVCVDAAYYTFPSQKLLAAQADQVPDGFRFAFKVTDAITIKRFPNLPRFGVKGGTANEEFLNADLFATQFLGPLETIRSKVGPLIFEFSKFYPSDYAHGRDFIADLAKFLGQLPKGWDYSIEMRNRQWLVGDYFACLRQHGVAHVFNSWARMPSIPEQLALPDRGDIGDLLVSRLLLTPGRNYEAAVAAFSPYDRIQEIDPKTREGTAELVRLGLQSKPRSGGFIYVNNRLEGNALLSIHAILELADRINKGVVPPVGGSA